MKHRSRVQQLNIAIRQWADTLSVRRHVIAAAIIEKVEQIGLTQILADEGITFNKTNDAYNDMRVNAQKIFRWIDPECDHYKNYQAVLLIEEAIVAAMPQDIRTKYLNAVYTDSGTYITKIRPSTEKLNAELVAIAVHKENSEALTAILNLKIIKTDKEAIRTHKELMEASAINRAGADWVERNWPHCFKDNITQLDPRR